MKLQFSLWYLVLFIPAAVGVLIGMWNICVQPHIDSGAFNHQKTYREVQIERGRQALERAKNAATLP